MITKPCSQSFSQKIVYLQIFRRSSWNVQDKTFYYYESCLKNLFSAVNGYYNPSSQSDFGVPDINSFLRWLFN